MVRIYRSLSIFTAIFVEIYTSLMDIWKKMWVGVFFLNTVYNEPLKFLPWNLAGSIMSCVHRLLCRNRSQLEIILWNEVSAALLCSINVLFLSLSRCWPASVQLLPQRYIVTVLGHVTSSVTWPLSHNIWFVVCDWLDRCRICRCPCCIASAISLVRCLWRCFPRFVITLLCLCADCTLIG